MKKIRSFFVHILVLFTFFISKGQDLSISGGNTFSMGVCQKGNILVWGNIVDASGKLYKSSIPVGVPASLPDITFTQADAGSGYHILALDCNKKVWAWGTENTFGQIGQPSSVTTSSGKLMPVIGMGGVGQLDNAVYVSGADKASFALLANGRIVSWGDNSANQLGRPTTGNSDYVPNYVLTAPGVPLENIIQVDAGDRCGYALAADGKVYSWGNNSDQELGRFATGAEIYAKPVLKLDKTPLTDIRSISGGDTHGLARDKNGNAWSWGGNWANQLGRTSNGNSGYADLVTGVGGLDILKNVREIAAGQATSMILVNNEGNIVTFGSNCLYLGNPIAGSGGVLGTLNTTCYTDIKPAYVRDCSNNILKNIVQISDGDAVIYAVSGDGSLFVLGNNLNGELGLGINDNISRGCAVKMPLASYDCDLVEPCPKPDLGANIPVCNVTELTTANVTLNTRYSRSYTYKWFYRLNQNGNFTQITNAADTNIYKPTKLGQYMVEVQRNYNNCSTCGIGYDTVNVDLPEPLFKLNNGTFCKESNLTFSVTGSGEFNWYTAQTGGTLDPALANKTSITLPITNLTPVFDGIDTVYNMYVEDVSIKRGTLIPSSATTTGTSYGINAGQNDQNSINQKTLLFNVIQAVKLDELSLKFFNYSGSTQSVTVTVTLYDSQNNIIKSLPNYAVNNVLNGQPSPGVYIIPFASPTLLPGNNYRLVIEGGNASIAFYETPNGVTYPVSSTGDLAGYITIKGTPLGWTDKPNAMPGIFDLKFSAQGGYPCGRAKVSMTKDCPCNKPALTISSSTGTTAFCNNIDQAYTLKVNPSPSVPAIDPFGYLYQWYKNGSALNTKNKDTLFLRSSSGEASYTVRVGHTSLLRAKCYTEAVQNITIQPRITNNNIISVNDTVCSGTAAKLIQGSDPAGGTGTITYVWLRSDVQSTGYTPIANSNTKDYSPGILTGSTYFRRLVLRGVCSDTSGSVRVVIDPAISDPGVYTGPPSPTICSGSKIPDLVFSPATGGTPVLKYQWESSVNQVNWTVMSQETGPAIINLPVITQKTFYRRKVASVKCSAISNAVLVGTDTSVTSNTFESNVSQVICLGSNPAIIVGSEPKGGVKPYAYKWQESASETGPFTDIPNSNSKDFTPPAVTNTTFYKRVVMSTGACANDISSLTAKVTVDPAVTAGSIQVTQSLICAGTSPVITNLVSPTGGTLKYKYKWQILAGGNWTDISVSNDSIPDLSNAPSINDETQFRRIVISALKCQATTDAITVKTTGQMRPGEIQVTDTSVCAGNTPGVIKSISPATGGTGNSGIKYQWQNATDANNWSDIAGEESETLLPGSLTIDTYYRRKASNGTGVCDEVYAGPVLIKQYKKLNPGTIQSSDTSICDGASALIRSTGLPANGSPNKVISWKIAHAPAFIFKDTAVATASLQLTALSHTVKVKRIVKDACGTDSSANTVTVNVFPKDIVSINITTDLSTTLCSDKPLEVKVSVSKAGNRTIVWEYDGQSFSSTPDSILTIIKPKNGAKIKAISTTDPRLICTTPVATSAEITLSINDPITNNTFNGGQQRLCSGSAINPIQGGVVSGGIQPSTYQWLSSENENGPFLPLTGVTGSSFTPAVTKTTYFKRIVTSTGVCKADTSSDFFRVFIDQPVIAGKDSLLSNTLCSGDTLRFSNLLPGSGGTGTLTNVWEFAINPNGPWSVIPNQSGDNLVFAKNNLDSLKNTFYFRKTIKSEICSASNAVIKAVICQQPHVVDFNLGKTCTSSDETFNILDTIVDRVRLKGDFSTNGWKLKVTDIKKLSSNIGSYSFTPGTPGSFTYRSKSNYIGKDTVVFNICEDAPVNAICVTKTFYFNVLPVNIPPIVQNEHYSTYKNQPILSGNILLNDGDPNGDTIYVWPSVDQSFYKDSLKKYTNSVLRLPEHGEVRMTFNGDLSYKPKEDFVGFDTAVFYVCDYNLRSVGYCTDDPFYCLKDTIVFEVKPYRIFIPDGFSPNGDGTNDYFVIRSEVPLNIDIKLYNRWGNLVYEKEHYQNDFDGKANRGLVVGGDGLPDGTYYLHYDVHDKIQDPNPGFKYITISR